MVKTVTIRVTVTQSQAFFRSCRHEVSSMFAASAEWTETASSLYGASRTAATASLQLGDHPGGDRQPEEVGGQLLDLPLAQPIGAREHGQHGLQIRPEAPTGDTGGQGPAGRLPAAGTGQAMEPVFVDDRLDPGQLGDLMDQRGGVVALKLHRRSGDTRSACSRRSRGPSRGGPRGGTPCDARLARPASCRWEGPEACASSRSDRTRGAWTSWWS